ncbi:hypothetical protein A1O1_01773 [Capronia coronata CBS 617.96]|uniref:Major facilitator superfamily (MFS) profile domain-containing protein n=1 Tax=Capronia coronata CBS 617.96 TaxID=1182541 RepID=W9YVV3_9EURO|nr:uncharacterized protein A1O1_01773 [Capronia coronata CBS 617.96]EXJ93381.1 hypothetical protein A1O1_01773 [Capronia coronata CBS 617.96]
MSNHTEANRPLVDPTAEEADGHQPTETTSLLPKPKAADEKPADVHYRNITGPRFRFLFASIIFGSTIAFFDSTLMASAHPVITSYFHASNAASWVSTVFYLTSTVFQPLYGRLSDTIGRRPVFLAAITMFFLSTAWCGAAGNIGSFIAARGVCGLGAGGVISMAGILTSDVVKIEYRGIYQSYFNVSYGLGNGLGAALGGLLCDRLGWRAAFYLQLPFIFVYGMLAFLSCPADLGPNLAKTQGKTIRESFKTFDSLGAIFLTVTVSCLILGVNLGGNVFPWTHPVVISSLVLFVVAAASLYFVERKAYLPIMPVKLLSTIPTANLMFSNVSGAIATNTIIFNVPLYLQAVRQTSPTESGLFLISPLIGGTITSVSVGFYITKTRRLKGPITVGTGASLIGTILAACLRGDTPKWAVPLLIPWCYTGQGLFFPATTVSVLSLHSQDEQAVVTTTLGLLRNLGAILGVAISSWVLQNALLVYLYRLVTAPDEAAKEAIIRTVRKSIQSIATLDPLHKGQVIDAYAQSIRVTFAVGIIFTFLSIVLVWPISLPRLKGQDEMDRENPGLLPPAADEEGVFSDDDTEEDDNVSEASLAIARTTSSIHRTTTNRSVRTAGSGSSRTVPHANRRPSFTLNF